MIKAVVFDIGGILEITPKIFWQAKWESKLGLTKGDLDRRLFSVWADGSIGKISEAQVEQRVGEVLRLTPAEVTSLMSDVWTEYLGTPNEELVEFFTNLRPTYKTALLSNSFVGAREREHELYRYGEKCDLIVYSHEVGVQKPDPKIYEMTYDRLNVEPNEIVFLDDMDYAIEGARQCGFHVVHYQNNRQAIAAIKNLLSG